MNIMNTCNSVGGIDGCCCDSNVCLDPENNVVTPAPTTPNPTMPPTTTKGSASLAISIATLITTGVFSLVRI
jgi:hypothetical protein